MFRGKLKFKIKWEGYGPEHDKVMICIISYFLIYFFGFPVSSPA